MLIDVDEPNESYVFDEIPNRAHVNADSSCHESLQIVNTWLRECTTDHANCSAWMPRSLPARVLDLGSAGEVERVQLYVTKREAAIYACLSHSWGKRPATLVMTQERLEAFRNEIPWEELETETTYIEAIEYCRRLHIRYLWIDSLCIIQNEKNDWLQESVQMATYFGGCAVCLAATSASDHSGGCSVKAQKSLKFAGTGGDNLPYCVFAREVIPHPTYLSWADHNFPLFKRAWIFQERRLAPRVLHFGPKELFFECESANRCQCGLMNGTAVGSVNSPSDQTNRPSFDNLGAVSQYWHSMISAYSRLDITFAADRLTAFSGMAKSLRDRTSPVPLGQYYAGLWAKTFVPDLLWRVNEPGKSRRQQRPGTYVAPTWSWASVTEQVEFPDNSYARDVVEILDVQTTPLGKDETGQLSHGRLTLRGTIMRTSWASRGRVGDPDAYILPELAGIRLWADYMLVTPGAHLLEETENVYLLAVATSEKRTAWLVLRQLADTEPGAIRRFERIGMSQDTESLHPQGITDLETTVITIL